MYLKTTSPQYYNFGYISDAKHTYDIEQRIYSNRKPGFYKAFDCEVSYKVNDGIALLVLLDENNEHHQFVIHRESVVHENIPHVLIPLTDYVNLDVSKFTNNSFKEKTIPTQESIKYQPIQSEVYVSDIYSYYYSVKGQRYFFLGESHSYWELTYVDTGELISTVDGIEHTLSSQNIMIYFPQQFHQQKIKTGKACSYLTIMFDLKVSSENVFDLKNKVLECTDDIRHLIQQYIKQATLMESHNQPYSRSLMIAHLQEIIVYLLQNNAGVSDELFLTSANPVQTNFENETIDEINSFILRNMDKNLTVTDLCEHFSFSRSSLQLLFKKHLGLPPKEYINDLKMKEAQRLVSSNKYTLTEVAHRLGFSSIHYFSRKFKSHFGITPSEYSRSIFKSNEV
ncbi:AraC family transcriptional regulator [Erysipelothrix urinaevulpis]|uniref:helix-turn-helix transcriptional regulator n=1 Tax=Erysipelothrix urinaevulpis TaxID=2683717 RepID=UPI001359A743|nr:AraC family transcriptional regulator [Erysipelothrix urinaevulpis]